MNDAAKDRLYIVLTDSLHFNDKRVLGRVAPQPGLNSKSYWTDVPEKAWQMDRETADDIVSRLSFNNPRVVRAKKALAQLASNFPDQKTS